MAKMKVPGGRMVGVLPEKATEKRTRKAKETAEPEKSAE